MSDQGPAPEGGLLYLLSRRQGQEREEEELLSGNLALVRRLYGAGWTMRLYYDLDPGPAGQLQLRQLCELACADPQLDLCRARSLPGRPLEDAGEVYPLLWRFFPTLDPQVVLYP